MEKYHVFSHHISECSYCDGARARILAIAVAISAELIGTFSAHAQGAQVYQSFLLTARAPNIVVNTASQSESLGLPTGLSVPVAYVCNAGAVLAYVAVGDTTVSADPNLSMPVIPGKCTSLNATGDTNIAAITDPAASDTTLLLVMLGSGSP